MPHTNAQKRHYYRANIDQVRTYHFIARYGIDLDEYNELFYKQGGKCAGCSQHQDNIKRALSVDHCHKTEKVRGLLCHSCNVALGMVKDNPKVLRKLAEYLEARGLNEKD